MPLPDYPFVSVIVGLAVGIAFVLLFSFYSSSFRDIVTGTTNSGGITISLEGLKKQYTLSEPLNFTVTAKGRGALCDHPTVKILHAKSAEVAYDFPNFEVVYECSPDPVDHNITWRLRDMVNPYSPILIGKLGQYILEVELGGVVLKKDFIIYDDSLSL